MPFTLFLSEPLRDQLATEARAAYPRECCGLIEGVREADGVRALALHPTANFRAEPDRFEIDPAAHIRLLRALRGTGRDIVGCYHSHPNGRAEPSDADRESAGDEGFVWLIAALGEAGPAAFSAFVVAADASFRPVALAAVLEGTRPAPL